MSEISTVLVTGANGLLGRAICDLLSQQEYEVFGLVHRDTKNKISGVNYISIDLETDWNVNLLPPKVDVVIHLAQSSHFRDFPEKALNVFQVNIASTAKLLDYAKNIGVRSFLYASSGGVYGNSNQAFSENSSIVPPGKLGYYLGSKLSGEVLTQSYTSVFNVNVLRYFFIYGPNQKKGMLIPRLMDSVMNHLPITLQGGSGLRINPIHVEDAAIATIAAIKQDTSAIYNISGPEILSLKDIGDMMGEYLGIKPEYQFLPEEAKDLIGDNSAMRKILYSPERFLKNKLDEIHGLLIDHPNLD